MLAFDRNGSGDRASFSALKYKLGDTTLMTSYDDSRKAQNQGRSRVVSIGATHKLDVQTTLKAGVGRQQLNEDVNLFYSLGADYALSKRTTLYASLGHQRPANSGARTSLGVGMSHAF